MYTVCENRRQKGIGENGHRARWEVKQDGVWPGQLVGLDNGPAQRAHTNVTCIGINGSKRRKSAGRGRRAGARHRSRVAMSRGAPMHQSDRTACVACSLRCMHARGAKPWQLQAVAATTTMRAVMSCMPKPRGFGVSGTWCLRPCHAARGRRWGGEGSSMVVAGCGRVTAKPALTRVCDSEVHGTHPGHKRQHHHRRHCRLHTRLCYSTRNGGRTSPHAAKGTEEGEGANKTETITSADDRCVCGDGGGGG